MRAIHVDHTRWWIGIALVSWMLGSGTTPMWAQYYGGTEEAKVSELKIRSVKPQYVNTPDVQVASFTKPGVMGGIPTKWLQVEVEFSSTPEWADNVEARWYFLVGSETKPVVFSDSVMHINIKRGSHHYSTIFMPPHTVDRYGQVKQIAVLLSHESKLVDFGGWPNAPTKRWWEDYTPVRGALLNLLQTPFGVLMYDRYEQIKVPVAP